MKKKIKSFSSKSAIKTKSKENASKVTETGSLQPRNNTVLLEIRLTEEHKDLFTHVAHLKGFNNVSDYIRHISLADALESIESSTSINLSLNGSKRLFEALEGSPRDIPALRKSLKEHLKENPQA